MIKTELNSKAISILKAKGWDDSQVSIEEDLAELREQMLETPPAYVVSLLGKFSGLEFEVFDDKFQTRSLVSFGLEKVFEIPSVKKILSTSEIIASRSFYPIGAIDTNIDEDNTRLILLMAEDESIYSAIECVINKEGHDIYDFINRVVDNNSLWRTDKAFNTNFSVDDPRLREFWRSERAKNR
jgi:hypothetical protein